MESLERSTWLLISLMVLGGAVLVAQQLLLLDGILQLHATLDGFERDLQAGITAD